MNEFKDQLDTAEKEKVSKLITELRELAIKGQAADPLITAETIRKKINKTQQSSLGLFQKVNPALLVAHHIKVMVLTEFLQVYKKRNAENNFSQSSESPEGDKEKKDSGNGITGAVSENNTWDG